MQIEYDSKYDLLYIRFSRTERQVETRRIDDDIALDFDAEDRLYGIEVLDASKRLDLSAILPLGIEAWQPTVGPDSGIQRAALPRASRTPRRAGSPAPTVKRAAAS